MLRSVKILSVLILTEKCSICKTSVRSLTAPCAQPVIRRADLTVHEMWTQKGPVSTGHKAHCCDCTLSTEADQHESINNLNWELVLADSLRTLFQEIKPKSLGSEIAHKLLSQETVDLLRRKKNENERSLKRCDAFTVLTTASKLNVLCFTENQRAEEEESSYLRRQRR